MREEGEITEKVKEKGGGRGKKETRSFQEFVPKIAPEKKKKK